jgi:autotransporter-associated beta strand protein
VNLNGAGPTTGQFSPFPGALRQSTGLAITLNNPVNLQSDSTIHVQGAAGGSLTLSGVVNGVGKLTFTAPNSNADIGKLVLSGPNVYSGGTLITGGTLELSGAAAKLGSGDVVVNNALSIASTAVLSILSGVSNAIADGAMLSLAGGAAGTAKLGSGIDDTVGSLVLGGATQLLPGTYGSSLSGATFQNDTYFSGPGVVRLATAVPEASSFLCVGLALAMLGISRKLYSRKAASSSDH